MPGLLFDDGFCLKKFHRVIMKTRWATASQDIKMRSETARKVHCLDDGTVAARRYIASIVNCVLFPQLLRQLELQWHFMAKHPYYFQFVISTCNWKPLGFKDTGHTCIDVN